MTRVRSSPEADVMKNSEFDDVEREMYCSGREAAGSFVPFANVDVAGMLKAARMSHRPSSRTRRLSPSRIGKITRCPECDGDALVPVVAGRKVNFFCQDCTLCWHVDGDEVNRVNPWTCPGCALVTTACFERFDLSRGRTP